MELKIKKTTLRVYCEARGWQGGTIHQAKIDFSALSLESQDKICSVLVNNMSNISDPRTILYFTKQRLGSAI